MSSFTVPLAYEGTEIFKGGVRRMVRIHYGFLFDDRRHGVVWDVEAGFLTDLGSIPNLARTFVAPDDPWAQAFALHDKLYDMLRRGTAPSWLTRHKADLILWDALGVPFRVFVPAIDGSLVEMRVTCPAIKRSAIYAAVRVGGGSAAVENSGRL